MIPENCWNKFESGVFGVTSQSVFATLSSCDYCDWGVCRISLSIVQKYITNYRGLTQQLDALIHYFVPDAFAQLYRISDTVSSELTHRVVES